MSLNYKILQNKKRINKSSAFDGTQSVECLDLLSKSIIDFDIDDFSFVIVEKEYIARPDLISLAIYGTDEYADVLCKVNGISNPFELNEGMLLFCPGLSFMSHFSEISPEPNVFITDDSTESIIGSKKTNKKSLNQKRSPIEATVLDNNYRIIEGMKGLVFY